MSENRCEGQTVLGSAQAIADGEAATSSTLTEGPSSVSASSFAFPEDEEPASTYDVDDDSADSSVLDEATAGAGACVAVVADGKDHDDVRALQAVLERLEEREAPKARSKEDDASLGMGAAEEDMSTAVIGLEVSVSARLSMDELPAARSTDISTKAEETIEVGTAGPDMKVAVDVGLAALASTSMLEEAKAASVC